MVYVCILYVYMSSLSVCLSVYTYENGMKKGVKLKMPFIFFTMPFIFSLFFDGNLDDTEKKIR